MRNPTLMLLVCLAAPALANDPLAGLGDPTRPFGGGAAPVRSAGPVLQSTMVSEHGASAVISGQTVSVGARVAGGEVVAIRPYEVVIRRGGRDQTLRMVPRLSKERGTTEVVVDEHTR
jgi:hypothetical protein